MSSISTVSSSVCAPPNGTVRSPASKPTPISPPPLLLQLFAQVGVGHRSVDTRPNCGNMLSGVAPFAIEQGLVAAQDGTTQVRVFNVNTRSRIDVTVRTPGGRVTYEGDARIDGVPGTAAPIVLNFMDVVGSVSGKLLPTGNTRDVIDGMLAGVP